jgi:hypothetical protein
MTADPVISTFPDATGTLPVIVYAPYELTVESDKVLVPATIFREVTDEEIVILLLDPASDVPFVQLLPAPFVVGVVPSSV